jgi:hypothetical protein
VHGLGLAGGASLAGGVVMLAALPAGIALLRYAAKRLAPRPARVSVTPWVEPRGPGAGVAVAWPW